MTEETRRSAPVLRLTGFVLLAAFVATTIASWTSWHEPPVQTRFYVLFIGWALVVMGSPHRTPRSIRAARVVVVAGVVLALVDLGVWLAGASWHYWAAFVAVCLYGFVAAPLLLLAPPEET